MPHRCEYEETHFQVRMDPDLQDAIRAVAAADGCTIRQATERIVTAGLVALSVQV